MKAVRRSFAITSHNKCDLLYMVVFCKVRYNEISYLKQKAFQSNVAYNKLIRMIILLCMIYSVSKCFCSYTNHAVGY